MGTAVDRAILVGAAEGGRCDFPEPDFRFTVVNGDEADGPASAAGVPLHLDPSLKSRLVAPCNQDQSLRSQTCRSALFRF